MSYQSIILHLNMLVASHRRAAHKQLILNASRCSITVWATEIRIGGLCWRQHCPYLLFAMHTLMAFCRYKQRGAQAVDI